MTPKRILALIGVICAILSLPGITAYGGTLLVVGVIFIGVAELI